MAEENTAEARPEEPAPAPEEGPPPSRGPLIPPVLVRGAIVGGILAVLAVGALLLVTEVIAPRIRATPVAPAGDTAKQAAKPRETKPGEDRSRCLPSSSSVRRPAPYRWAGGISPISSPKP